MANLQYIGARYVPKFYENPNTGDMTWKSNTAYEPLTVVKYNDDTYTSKIPVPSSVGNPAANSTYWAKTADFNAALVALQNTVNSMQIELATKAPSLINRKILVVGDSYGIHSTNYYNFFAAICGTTHIENLSVGGAGFIDSTSFLDAVTNYNGTMEREDITDILCLGGVNDANSDNAPSITKIENAINTFMTYVKSEYPNASVYVGMVGGIKDVAGHGTFKTYLNDRVLPAYKNCNKYGAIYLNGVENVMQDYVNNFGSDGVHPNTTGCEELAWAIFQAWTSGEFKILKSATSYTLNSDVTQSNFSLMSKQDDNYVDIAIQGELTFATHFTGKYGVHKTIFDVGCPFVRAYSGSAHNVRDIFILQGEVYSSTDDQTYTYEGTYPISFYLGQDGKSSIEILHPTNIANVARVFFYGQHFVVDSWLHR